MKDKLLQASDNDLPRLLGEVLQAKHCYIETNNGPICIECGNNKRNSKSEYCPIPIDDWNVAMKWRDWAVEKTNADRFGELLSDVLKAEYHCWRGTWIMGFAQPKHYEIAAALCKIGEKK